jgi:ubiquinone/menaquinone biosynthesis C-methylase UbiE
MIGIPIMAAVLVGLLGLWELWICEGAHLGRRFVVWLYDLTATRYERIKQFDRDWERHFLGEPIARTLLSLRGARILDVGAGTGRAARALLPSPLFDGSLVNLEPSKAMSRVGRGLVGRGPVSWVRAWSVPLPFPPSAFDLVICLEVLEFTPRPEATLKELVRVLRPGGWLLITNRIDWQAPLIFGRTWSRQAFTATLCRNGLQDVQVFPWQKTYDLTWARKAWPQDASRSDFSWSRQ